MPHATAQSHPFSPTPPSLTLHQLNEKLRAADACLEQASRLLMDGRKHLYAIPGFAARKIRVRLDEQSKALSATRQNLEIFVVARRREILAQLPTEQSQ